MERSELLSARVPRYTSYPTAPHFHDGIDAARYRSWLSDLPPGMPVSLYLHVPFCDTLCWFCGCHTSVVNRYAPVKAYYELLTREIAAVAAAIGPGHPVTHLHWGGGSPTLLTPDDVRSLADELHRSFAFAPGAEFAVEIDPRGLSDAMVDALAEAGVTRASIGVQDESPVVQRAINRIQPHEITASALNRLRAAGVADCNIDLIYGLPHQGPAELAETIRRTLELTPQRFAVFGFAYLPSFKKHMSLIPPESLPDAAARLEAFDLAHEMLCAAGYAPVGLDHFAVPEDALVKAARAGRLHRNFQGYTDDNASALIGLGASAIGRLPQGYVQNFAPVPDYRRCVAVGDLATARGLAFSDEDRLRGVIIERLMCDLAVDLDAVGAPFGRAGADFAPEMAALAPLEARGFVRISGGRIEVPARARFGVRLVAAAFDAYLSAGKAVHAVAV